MNIYRPVFENSSTVPFIIHALDKSEAKEKMHAFLKRNTDCLHYLAPEVPVDVEFMEETKEEIVVL